MAAPSSIPIIIFFILSRPNVTALLRRPVIRRVLVHPPASAAAGGSAFSTVSFLWVQCFRVPSQIGSHESRAIFLAKGSQENHWPFSRFGRSPSCATRFLNASRALFLIVCLHKVLHLSAPLSITLRITSLAAERHGSASPSCPSTFYWSTDGEAAAVGSASSFFFCVHVSGSSDISR